MSASYLSPRQKQAFFKKVCTRLKEKDWTWVDLAKSAKVPRRTLYRYRDLEKAKVPRSRAVSISLALNFSRPKFATAAKLIYAELRKVLRSRGEKMTSLHKVGCLVFWLVKLAIPDNPPVLTLMEDPQGLVVSLTVRSKRYPRLSASLVFRTGWKYNLLGYDIINGVETSVVLMEGKLTVWIIKKITESMKLWLAQPPKNKSKSFT